jgi:protein PsiE
MEKITKNLQLALLSIILTSTIIAIGIELKSMVINQIVSLADLLLMFLYLEVVAMVRVFWQEQTISIHLTLLIAITALARQIILQGKEMDPTALVYESFSIVLIASAIVILSFKDTRAKPTIKKSNLGKE